MSTNNIDKFKENGPQLPKMSSKTFDFSVEKEDGVFVFLSFDICNSTEMKDVVTNWKQIIIKFYETKIQFRHMTLWKFIGDEIVFHMPYTDIGSFLSLIRLAYNKIGALQDELNNAAKTTSSAFKINIKGTMWLAYISNYDTKRNIQIAEIGEFVGKQIDEGFRMSEFSSGGKLLLDPKIVFILLSIFCYDGIESPRNSYKLFSQQFMENVGEDFKNTILKHIDINLVRNSVSDILEQVYFVNYKTLKGIWGNSPYPIYWYFDSKDRLKYFEDKPIKILAEQDNSKISSENRFYSKELFKVFETVQAEQEIIDIFDMMAKNQSFDATFSRHGVAQLYYSIACVKDDKVFIAQRSYERKHLRGVWEFGFQKHNDVDVIDNIKRMFKNDFNLNVELLTDGTDENNIIPVHFCATYRNNLKHNSILCCARIDDERSLDEIVQSVNAFLNDGPSQKRYLQVDFVDINEANNRFQSLTAHEIEEDSYNAQIDNHKSFNKGDDIQKAVMYFNDTVKAVLSFVKRWNKLSDGGKWYDLYEI